MDIVVVLAPLDQSLGRNLGAYFKADVFAALCGARE
jgi:hypothetical protein